MSISRSKLYRTLLLVVTISLPLVGSLAAPQRALPEDNLAYPVLITLKSGPTGSGFYLNNGKAIYLVTAKHVLFDPDTGQLRDVALELLSYPKAPSDSKRNLLALDLPVLQTGGNIKPHPSEDVAVVKVGAMGEDLTPGARGKSFLINWVPGITSKENAEGGVVGTNLDGVKPFEQVLTGNDVMVFGYPTSLGLQQFPQIDSHRPLLRKGIVAGTNPDRRSIVLDCPSYPGNSGGPVLELDREAFQTHLMIIGVIIQSVPFVDTGVSKTFIMQMASNSGYSIATPMNVVIDLIK